VRKKARPSTARELTLRFSERANAQRENLANRRIGIPRAASSFAFVSISRHRSPPTARAHARAMEGRPARSRRLVPANVPANVRVPIVGRAARKRRARIIRGRAIKRIINGAGARKCVKRLRKVQIMRRARLFPIAFNR
jgi:hypothetical protein